MTSSAPGSRYPRRNRLTKTDEYSSVFSFRRAFKSPHFLLHYRPRPISADGAGESSGARLGVVVAKRLLKSAVRRNLVKRIAREQFRQMLSILPSSDLVLRLANRPDWKDRKGLASEIRGLLQKTIPTGR